MTKQFHPDELALLAAIHADQRDDTPRLVYADWLEEHDQLEYAEFIRLDIRKHYLDPEPLRDGERPPDHTLPAGTPFDSLRWQELITLGGDGWKRPLPRWLGARRHHYHRGLPYARLDWPFPGGEYPPRFEASCRALSPRVAIRVVTESPSPGNLAELLASPLVSQVHEIHFEFARLVSLLRRPAPPDPALAAGLIETLAVWPSLPRIEWVYLNGLPEDLAEGARDRIAPSVCLTISSF